MSDETPTGREVFIDTAQRINAALDANRWQEAENLARAAVDAARGADERRWADRFERLITFARARGRAEPSMPASVACSFCSGGQNGDRFVAGPGVFICSGCVTFLCEARSAERLSANQFWSFIGDLEPTESKCLFCGIGRPLFVGRPGGLCTACLSTAESCLKSDQS
jgi:hypothetical protein